MFPRASLVSLIAALVVASGTAAEKDKTVIPRSQLQDMFDAIKARGKWDMSRKMLWGYFFTHASREPLEKASEALSKMGYRVVSIDLAEKDDEQEPDVWWLHVERVETHSVNTLDKRNRELVEFAIKYGLDSYDGMDVGLPP